MSTQNHQQSEGHSHEAHSHGLTRSEELDGVSDLRLIVAVVLNHVLTVGQVVAGVLSGSVALLSDAAHNFNDANALLIAYIARRISRQKANERFTFGYRRAELIGALINLTSLAIIGLYLVYEAITRLVSPQPIVGWLMAAAAGLALVIDIGTALLLWTMRKGSLNTRAAFIHNLVDALGSLAVLAGAAAIIWLNWTWVDPVLTLIIAAYVLWQVVTMLPQAARILMEGAPHGADLQAMIDRLGAIDGVEDIHHVHLWELDEAHQAFEAHVQIQHADAGQLESVKKRLKQVLSEEFGVSHSTLEFEFESAHGGCASDNMVADGKCSPARS